MAVFIPLDNLKVYFILLSEADKGLEREKNKCQAITLYKEFHPGMWKVKCFVAWADIPSAGRTMWGILMLKSLWPLY